MRGSLRCMCFRMRKARKNGNGTLPEVRGSLQGLCRGMQKELIKSVQGFPARFVFIEAFYSAMRAIRFNFERLFMQPRHNIL